MSNLLSRDQSALKMLFTEDIYLVQEDTKETPAPILKPESIAREEVRTPLETPAPVEIKMQAEVKVPEITAQPEVSHASTDFEYLGENNKYFLILIEDKIHTRINPVHQEMLLKIITAKKLELRDLAIVNMNRYPDTSLAALKSFFSPSRLLLFGVTPAQISLPAMALNKVGAAGNVKVLATYSLGEMEKSKEKKMEFWNIMKNF